MEHTVKWFSRQMVEAVATLFIRGVPIWVFLHVPMSDIDSTKNIDNRYSLPIFLLVIKQK